MLRGWCEQVREVTNTARNMCHNSSHFQRSERVNDGIFAQFRGVPAPFTAY
jgi:hypothetical protein